MPHIASNSCTLSNLTTMSLSALPSDIICTICSLLDGTTTGFLVLSGCPQLRAKILRETSALTFSLPRFSPFPNSAYLFPKLAHLDVSLLQEHSNYYISGAWPTMLPKQPVPSLTSLRLTFPRSGSLLTSDQPPLCSLFPSLTAMSLIYDGSLTKKHLRTLPSGLQSLELINTRLSYNAISKGLPHGLEYLHCGLCTVGQVSLFVEEGYKHYRRVDGSREHFSPSDRKQWWNWKPKWPKYLKTLKCGLGHAGMLYGLPSELEELNVDTIEEEQHELYSIDMDDMDIDLSRLPRGLRRLTLRSRGKAKGRLPPTLTYFEHSLNLFHIALTLLPHSIRYISGIESFLNDSNFAHSVPPNICRLALYSWHQPPTGFSSDTLRAFLPHSHLTSAYLDTSPLSLLQALPATVTDLRCCITSDEAAEALPRNLRHLHVQRSPIHQLSAEAFAKLPRHIKDLDAPLRLFPSSEVFDHFSELQTLTLGCSQSAGSDRLSGLADHLPVDTLVELELEFVSDASWTEWIKTSRFRKLKSICVSANIPSNLPALSYSFFDHLPSSLRSLQVPITKGFEEAPPLKNLPSLTVLRLNATWKTKNPCDRMFLHLPDSLTELALPADCLSQQLLREKLPRFIRRFYITGPREDRLALDNELRRYYLAPIWQDHFTLDELI